MVVSNAVRFAWVAVALLGVGSLGAMDLTKYSDLKFAEEYAFSTNREAVIAQLKQNTGPWYFYTLLNLQTSGRYDEARKFVKEARRDNETGTQQAWDDLQVRQKFCDFDAAREKPRDGGRTPDEFLVYDLTHPNLGNVTKPDYIREVPLKPNTYPSALDQSKITFAQFFEGGIRQHGLKENFAFLDSAPGIERKYERRAHDFNVNRSCPPGAPGFFDAVVAYLKVPTERFSASSPAFQCLTLAQLEKLQQTFAGDPKKDLGNDEGFVKLVIEKLDTLADEGGEQDGDAQRRKLERVLAFVRTLPSAQNARKTQTMRELLKLYADCGDYLAHRDLLDEFVAGVKDWRNDYDANLKLVCEYLAAFRRAGRDIGAYGEAVTSGRVRRITAETDLLEGREPAAADLKALRDEDYRELQNRVDLKWSKRNPKVFAADDDVSLEIDVKNVKKMRIAVYDLDPFEALVKLGGEVKGDLDLDGCVPNVERTVDYSSFKSIRRHCERLAFPELKQPGLYVVECSGEGKCSRAVVRKGRLHLVHRTDAGGFVFTALNDEGRVAKPSRLRIGSTTYQSDERGEIAVPFAAKPELNQTVVVGAGRLAARETFEHLDEKYDLTLNGLLPQEGVIAGSTAKLLLRPTLRVSGARAPLEILKDVMLTVTLTDADGIESVKTVEDFKVEDDAESVYAFTVPERLTQVDVRLTAEVRNVSQGKDEQIADSTRFRYNTILRTARVEQAILRRGAEGYVLELRGRNGEPLGSRAVKLTLFHRCFVAGRADKSFTLQADEKGLVQLGPLADIERIALAEPFRREWRLLGTDWSEALPSELTAFEGEPVEIAARGILEGAWPFANDIRARLSLVSLTAMGKTVADCTSAVSVSNGVVRVAGLPAGDYRLDFVAEGRSVGLSVVRGAGKTVEGGMLVGQWRGVADTGDPKTLRIDSVRVADGKLKVELANAADGARVHVLARRAVPDVTDPSRMAFATLLGAIVDRPQVADLRWSDPRAKYISERDLGDKLRYILDRRNLPHRPGNLLERPSLLLNPWSEKETATQELTTRAGEDWAAAEDASRTDESAEMKCTSGGYGYGDASSRAMVLQNSDFLKHPCELWANLRPDAQGRVELMLPAGLEAQDITVIALDVRGADTATLLADKVARCAKRDLRFRNGDGRTRYAKTYGTVGELYRLMTALAPNDQTLAEFAFVVRWPKLSDTEKRELYGKYASHELDLFLAFKDRAFFDAVVAPHLRNKRFKQFTDLWLLGEDVKAFAEPGRFQDLNALERCLLAERMPELAPVVARDFADFCAAHPVAPEIEDRLLATALDIHSREAEPELQSAGAETAAGGKWRPAYALAPAGVMKGGRSADTTLGLSKAKWSDTGWSNQAVIRSPVQMELMAASRNPGSRGLAAERRREMKRRENRQLYRPPERTREWMETHHYRRRHADRVAIAVNPFWRDWAAAIAKGEGTSFRSTGVMYAGGGFTEAMAALAVTALPFAADGMEIAFGGREDVATAGEDRGEVTVLQRFTDPTGSAERVKYVTDEFVAGHAYEMLTIVTNPSENRRRVNVAWQLPEGAIPLGGGKASANESLEIGAYAVAKLSVRFYFPVAEQGIGGLKPATVAERGALLGRGTGFVCAVVPEATTVNRTSWAWISQNGTSAEALELLKTANFHEENVEKIGWRMKDAAFREQAFAILDSRGIFNEGLWTTALDGRYAICDNTARVRQLLASGNVQARLKDEIGPYFRSSLVEIDPEENDIFEHREYWPLVNARAHTLGGTATIANEGLKRQYRAFLDVLAMKPALAAKDRLLAAVYLLAQDRVDEAKEQVRMVKPEDVETRMQLDYLNAYLAFSDGRPEAGRTIASRHLDEPVRRWRERFGEVVRQADEIAGRASGEAAGGGAEERVPSLALDVKGDGELVIRSENVRECLVKAYPTDVEMTFSKNPFGNAAVKDAATLIRPVWQVAYAPERRRKLTLPKELLRRNLIVEVTDEEGRATATATLLAGALDVQVARERGRLRVRDAEGRPLAAAYVKVYARDASGRAEKFHKDGYTDLRGLFDYASVSTDSEFKPAEFAVLVLREDVGVKTLTVKVP